MLESILYNLVFFLVIFLLIFLVEYFIICKEKKNKKGKRTEKLTTEGKYLISRFNLDDTKINLARLNFHISIMNSFIISFVSTLVCAISDNIGIDLALGFVLLIALIYSIYEIYGRRLKKKIGKSK